MCKQCHDSMSDEDFEESISYCVTKPYFEKWNSTSIGILLIGACIRESSSVRSKCIYILSMYLQWRYENTICFVYDHYDYNNPSGSMDLMPSKQKMEKFLLFLLKINLKYDHTVHESYLEELRFLT